MSSFLLLNLEDFSLNQDIQKIKQPFNSFCICCLDRNGPMFDLENCSHSDYLDAFAKPELKEFNQLVCYQCHCMLKKIKCFQAQVMESYGILLSGEFTNATVNNIKVNNMGVKNVVVDLHLPPEMDLEETVDGIGDNKDFTYVQAEPNMEQNFVHNIADVIQDNSNMDQSFVQNMTKEVPDNASMEQNFTHNMVNVVPDNLNIEQTFAHNMVDLEQSDSNLDQNFSHNLADVVQNDTNMEPFNNIEDNLIKEQNRMNKNIKTALEILERNNQSFVSLSSQLQFLNGEHLSFLEPSLLSKEILTDIPLVPAKSLNTDLENGLLNNTKSLEIEIDSTDKIFYDSLDLSPELMRKETNAPVIIKDVVTHAKNQKETEPKIKSTVKNLKKERKTQKPNSLKQMFRRITLTHEELDRERVKEAQSETYLKYKFRCETCIVGFNYKENLEDHVKRKHGPKEEDGVICEICSQVIPNVGSVTVHNYRHYARFECVRCNKRCHTHDEAMQHYTKHRYMDGPTTKRASKNKPTVQLKKVKLKMKPT